MKAHVGMPVLFIDNGKELAALVTEVDKENADWVSLTIFPPSHPMVTYRRAERGVKWKEIEKPAEPQMTPFGMFP